VSTRLERGLEKGVNYLKDHPWSTTRASPFTQGVVSDSQQPPNPDENSPKSRWLPKREYFPELGNNVLTSSLKIPQQRAQNVKLGTLATVVEINPSFPSGFPP
jgi:hypothetical protein